MLPPRRGAADDREHPGCVPRRFRRAPQRYVHEAAPRGRAEAGRHRRRSRAVRRRPAAQATGLDLRTGDVARHERMSFRRNHTIAIVPKTARYASWTTMPETMSCEYRLSVNIVSHALR